MPGGKENAHRVVSVAVSELERVTGSGVRFANPDPSLAGSVGRIPTNAPLARLLNGIPPHRFDSLVPVGNENAHRMVSAAVSELERVTGIEPALSAWKAEVLPLNHTRICKDCWSGRQDLNLRHPAPKAGALPNCATSRLCSLVIISDYFNVSEIFFRNARRAFPRCDTLFFWACDTWASVSSPPNSSGTNSGS